MTEESSVYKSSAILYARRVPTVHSPQCACGLRATTVRHVLLTCPQWTSLREEYIRPLRSTNLGTILNSAKGCNAAVRFILRSQLLEQFKGIACESPAVLRFPRKTQAQTVCPIVRPYDWFFMVRHRFGLPVPS